MSATALDPTVAKFQRLQRALEESILKCSTYSSQQRRPDLDTSKIQQDITKVTLLLIELKAASRNAHLHFSNCRQKVISRRKELDATYLKLKNLQYEKEYLIREIRACNEMRTPALDLMASEEGLETVLTKSLDSISFDAHAANLEILREDIEARESLRTELLEMKKKHSEMNSSVDARQKWLDIVPDALAEVEEAARPLKSYCGSERIVRRSWQKEAMSLPKPLYVLFCQLEAYCASFGDEDGSTISVIPSKQFDILDQFLDHSTRDSLCPTFKKKRVENNVEGAHNSNCPQVVEVSSQMLKEAYVCSDLAVKLKIKSLDSSDSDVAIRFQYLKNIDLVVAEVTAGPPLLLIELFPGDTGIQSPDLSHNHISFKDSTGSFIQQPFNFPSEIRARPFKWVQWLSGLYFADSKQESLEPSTRAVMKRINSRLITYTSLEEQIEKLTRGIVPNIHSSVRDFFPPALSESIYVIEFEEIKSDGIEKKRNHLSDLIVNHGYRIFKCSLKYMEVVATMQIQVHPNYPIVPPTFSIESEEGCDVSTSMELEVNVYCSEFMSEDVKCWDMILTHQFWRVLMCLQVIHGQPTPVGDPSRGSRRGKLRSLPFQFSRGVSGFIHR